MSPVRQNIMAMKAYVPGEQIHEPDWIKLNTNENPYGPSPAVARFLRDMDINSLRRYPDPECSRLRRRIGELNGCSPECVFVGNGSDEILALCTRAFVENDRAIAFFEPSYSLYPALAAIRAAPILPTRLTANFTWRDPDTTNADLFLLTSPNAPTGMGYSRENIERLCNDFKGIVVIDEAYADFADTHCMDLALRMPNVMVARTLSKAYALAGIRCGYVIGPAQLISALLAVKDSYNVSAMTQGAALAALNDEEHTLRSVRRIRHDRERLAEFMRDKGWIVHPSQTNFLWVRPAGITAHDLFQALRQRKILTRWFAGPLTEACLRITIGTESETNRLMDALDTQSKL